MTNFFVRDWNSSLMIILSLEKWFEWNSLWLASRCGIHNATDVFLLWLKPGNSTKPGSAKAGAVE
jgi:hypothetical protein